ncbi:MBL fold metallo-hydrolase [Dehalobacter sp. DCM]|uniref:MBL fold metallo-hydrolase n=1 Tax=Dehalobacter sp. DCM TaxID=2907827 RepID=UPI003081D28F|nr:MBL fold metallo-hydrolase [Dehalobacter sp. DCM]
MAVAFKILGTGAGPGIPSYYCDCISCNEARENPCLARTRSGAVVNTGKETVLIDASADMRAQLVREDIRHVDVVFISHWHYDHFGGLGDLEYYVRLYRKEKIKLFLPPDALEEFEAAYPFLLDVFDIALWQFGEKYTFGECDLIPLPANHSRQTAGFVLEAKQRLAYFTDTAGLPEETAARIRGIDYLICDATFYKDNWYPHSHQSVAQAIQLGQDLNAQSTILTHMAMHYSEPVTVAQLTEQLQAYSSAVLAYDGMVITL